MSADGFLVRGAATYGVMPTGSARFNSLNIGTNNNYYWGNNGDLRVHDLYVDRNGTSLTLEDYIVSVINTMLTVNYTTKTFAEFADSDPVVNWIGGIIRR